MPFWTFQFSYQLWGMCAAQIHQTFLGWMGFQVGGKKRSFLNSVLHTVMLRKNGQQSKYLTLLRRCRKMFYTTRTSRRVYALQLQTKDATIQEEARYVFHSLYWLVRMDIEQVVVFLISIWWFAESTFVKCTLLHQSITFHEKMWMYCIKSWSPLEELENYGKM